MSAAPEFPPDVFIPERARVSRPQPRRAHRFTVVAPASLVADLDDSSAWGDVSWHRAAARPGLGSAQAEVVDVRSLRLTRRGVAALAAVAVVGVLGLLLAAWASAPSGAAHSPAPASVVVQPGDTLWSVAQHVAPNRDPRAEVDELAALNHLGDGALTPGQVLRTR
jgi:hypothetical protein